MANASAVEIIFWLLAASFFAISSLSQQSALVPTRRKGTPGQWCTISGTHLALTFVKLSGLTTLKQTRNTLVSGYEMGLSLS